MHILLASLSAIYQGNVPILQYSQRHADKLSRMHLRCVLTGEITPWIDRILTYISDPLHNEDPEPYSKHYSVGGLELTLSNLESKTQNDRNHDTPGPIETRKRPLPYHTQWTCLPTAPRNQRSNSALRTRLTRNYTP
jgi:hypothetical protein